MDCARSATEKGYITRSMVALLLLVSLLITNISLGALDSSQALLKNDESTYSYTTDAGRDRNVEMINIHFRNALHNEDTGRDVATVDRIWQLSDQDPSQVIYKNFDERSIDSRSPLRLEDGYEIAIKSIDNDGNKVFIELSKDGIVIDSAIVVSPKGMEQASYVYTKDLEEGEKVELIKVHFKNLFRGSDQNLATVDSIWQASDRNTLYIIKNSSNDIIFSGGTPLKLGEGYELAIKHVDLDGKKANLELDKNGVTIDSKLIEPPVQKVATFIYAKNIGRNKKTEILKIQFKNAFRGTDQNIATVDSIWQASDRNPSHILNSSSEDIVLTSRAPLKLGEGYELTIKSIDIDGNKVYVELSKNGEEVHSVLIVPPINKMIDTYTYCRDSEQCDGGLITVHFANVFRGSDQNLATVDSIWQMSESDPSVVLTKDVGKRTVTSGTPLKLGEGYELAIKSIDIDGNKVLVELSKNGTAIDSAIIIPPNEGSEAYIYVKNWGDEKAEILKIQFKNAFRGSDLNIATVDSIWQASDRNYSQLINSSYEDIILASGTPLKLGEGYELAIKSIDIDGNKVYVELNKDGKVIDSTIVMPPIKPITTYIFTKITGQGNQTDLIKVHFKNGLRGADQNIATVDRIWQASELDPSIILIEQDREMTITSGTPLRLEEGYELAIRSIDIDSNKVYVELSKNGEIVNQAILIPSIGVSSEASKEDEDEQTAELKVLLSSKIMAMIKQGEPIKFNKITVIGDLDLSKIMMESVPVNRSDFEIAALSLAERGKLVRVPISIRDSEIRGAVNFGNAIFKDAVDFGGTNFSREATFDGSRFKDVAIFAGSIFNNETRFEGTQFNDGANFLNAHLREGVSFRGAHFLSYALFKEANFSNDVYLWGVRFDGAANFQDAKFMGDAYFSGSAFDGDVNFKGSQFNKIAYFRGSKFKGVADFNESRLGKEVFFEGAIFQDILNLTSAKYEKLYISWSNIEKLEYDNTAYQLLMENFKKIGFLEDADNCYYDYRREHMMQALPELNPLEASFRMGIDFLSYIFYGFGVRPLYPLAWSILSVILFGLFWGGMPKENEKNELNKSERQEDQSLTGNTHNAGWMKEIISLEEALRFSATVFLSGTKFFVDPPAVPQMPGKSISTIKTVFALERLTGALFSILLFLAISRTIIR